MLAKGRPAAAGPLTKPPSEPYGNHYAKGSPAQVEQVPPIKTTILGNTHGSAVHEGQMEYGANLMQGSGRYGAIYMNKTLSTATNGSVQDARRPDLIGVRAWSGQLDVVQVQSPSQSMNFLNAKVSSMGASLSTLLGSLSGVVPQGR